jgi:hypothetical protein
MNSNDCLKTPDTVSFPKVRLVIRGYPIVAFKNRKRIAGKKLITDPRIKEEMEKLIQDLEWQLLLAFQTIAAEMGMGHSPRSLIASLTPEDDCWTQIPKHSVECELVEKGKEGCEIIIERLD